jgi:hypothetical protein
MKAYGGVDVRVLHYSFLCIICKEKNVGHNLKLTPLEYLWLLMCKKNFIQTLIFNRNEEQYGELNKLKSRSDTGASY